MSSTDNWDDESDPDALLPTADDWLRLAELRESFLAAEGGTAADSYWRSRRDFELYDATFAARIGWKWDAVLRELTLRGRVPSGATLVDWGCGTGIATRRVVASVPGIQHVHLCDRSKQATWFARDALATHHPKLKITLHAPAADEPIDILLASHVVGELAPEALEELLALAARARFVIFVEAGSRPVSRALGAVRERLLPNFDVLAPCTHSASCGLLAAGREQDWCHFFARPPAEAFTSAFWRRFSDELGIDLRALPYAFVALARRGEPLPPRGTRVLGRPRLLKGRALLECCDASGVATRTLFERDAKPLFKRLDRSGELLLADVRSEGERIVEFHSLAGD